VEFGGRGGTFGSLAYPLPFMPSLQVSAGSLYPAIARLTVQAPPSRGTGFLSIEPLDPRSPSVGDTFILNLQPVGIPAPTFSHYYYMVCGTWGIGVLGVGLGAGCIPSRKPLTASPWLRSSPEARSWLWVGSPGRLWPPSLCWWTISWLPRSTLWLTSITKDTRWPTLCSSTSNPGTVRAR